MSQLVHSVNTPSDRREGFSERSKIYAFVRTPPPQLFERGTGQRNKMADPQRGLALRSGGIVPRHLPVRWKVAVGRAERGEAAPLSSRRSGAGSTSRDGDHTE